MSLSDCLGNLTQCVWFSGGEKRNAIASIVAGLLFFVGWWLIIDVNVTCFDHFYGTYHLCGIFATVSFIMVNSVSNAVVQGDGYMYDGGCLGSSRAKIWLFLGFVIGFASIIVATWILFADFVAKNTKENPIPQWAGSGLFLQNCFIFIASLVYKFGRVEEQW